MLRPLRDIFPSKDYPSLIVGLDAPDDSAVYALDAERGIVSTLDFFPPVVDDPYAFGAIAAANALSDVYAMGGEPLMAINLVAFPDGLDHALLSEILRGGAEKVREAGAVIAGGHTVTDKEPKYGLAVTGLVHPGRILTKGGARPGDRLLLTKPLGTGVITTALKNDQAQEQDVAAAVASMTRLNRDAARAAQAAGVHAMTDITGYGLLGHAYEMAAASSVTLVIENGMLPWLPGVFYYAEQDCFPGGMHRNRAYYSTFVEQQVTLAEPQEYLLYDPQTSGGLLIAVPEAQAEALCARIRAEGDAQAALIGFVQAGTPRLIIAP